MKLISFALMLVMTLLVGCSDRPIAVVHAPSAYAPSYYVGNTLYGRWGITPMGTQVWIFDRRYSHIGPSSLDLALAGGLAGLYYRNVWRSSYPGGWGSTGSYDRSRNTVINKTVINNYGSVDKIRKQSKSPAFTKKRDTFKKSGKGLPKPSKKMSTAHAKNKKAGTDTKQAAKRRAVKKQSPNTAEKKGLGAPTKTAKAPPAKKKALTISQQRAAAKKQYKPPVKRKVIKRKPTSQRRPPPRRSTSTRR